MNDEEKEFDNYDYCDEETFDPNGHNPKLMPNSLSNLSKRGNHSISSVNRKQKSDKPHLRC